MAEVDDPPGRSAQAGGGTELPGHPGGFEAAYVGAPPPWDIGRPQPAFVELSDAGLVNGQVLDVGCGTGEHALLAASRGLAATGVDAAPTAIALARRKATERGLTARFVVADALALAELDERFDTVLDCGLFHVFDDDQRQRYVASLHAATRPGGRYLMLGFSDLAPGTTGPRRLTRGEITACFARGWRVDQLTRSALHIRRGGSESMPAWLAVLTRI
jgi:SAM-dependent methyltransferase